MSGENRPHILVVEDNARIAETLALTLEMSGYRASQAGNGHEALERLRADLSIALIILDLLMPEMDGVTFLRHLRAEPTTSRIPVIIASAISPPPEVEAFAALRKPLALDALLSAVEQALRSIA
jgi:two-component system, chemotaxis family, sensor histidine kinase and response regulator PixL